MTTRAPQQLKAYQEGAYDFCDVIDRLADARGEAFAGLEVNRAIADLADRYPRVTMEAIGAGRSTAYVLAYKAEVAINGDAYPSTQPTTKERTPHASPGMGLYEEALKELGEDAVHAVLKAAIDHYRAAKKAKAVTKTYDPTTDPLAVAFGADQAQPGHRTKDADSRTVDAYDRALVSAAEQQRRAQQATADDLSRQVAETWIRSLDGKRLR